MFRLKRPKKRRRFGAAPPSKKEESVRRKIAAPAEPLQADLLGVADGPFAGPTRDLSQDPMRVQRVLERLRVEHAELWLTANELKDKMHAVTREKSTLEITLRRYQGFFHFSSDPQIVSDGAGVVKECNLAAGRLLRGDAATIVGNRLSTFIDQTDAVLFAEALSSLAEGANVDLALCLRTRAGTRPSVRLRARVLPTNTDEVLWAFRI